MQLHFFLQYLTGLSSKNKVNQHVCYQKKTYLIVCYFLFGTIVSFIPVAKSNYETFKANLDAIALQADTSEQDKKFIEIFLSVVRPIDLNDPREFCRPLRSPQDLAWRAELFILCDLISLDNPNFPIAKAYSKLKNEAGFLVPKSWQTFLNQLRNVNDPRSLTFIRLMGMYFASENLEFKQLISRTTNHIIGNPTLLNDIGDIINCAQWDLEEEETEDEIIATFDLLNEQEIHKSLGPWDIPYQHQVLLDINNH